MKITGTRINKLENAGNTVAMANVTIDNEFVITGIRVVNGAKGLFIAMPSRKDKNDEYRDIIFPVSSEAREAIQTAVLDAYNNGTEIPEAACPGIEITEVRVNPLKEPSNTLAMANVTIDGAVAVTGIRIVTGSNGEFIGMPSRKDKNGEYRDIGFPITKEAREKLQNAVLDEFKKVAELPASEAPAAATEEYMTIPEDFSDDDDMPLPFD